MIDTIASLAVSLSWWSYRRSLSRKSMAYVEWRQPQMKCHKNVNINMKLRAVVHWLKNTSDLRGYKMLIISIDKPWPWFTTMPAIWIMGRQVSYMIQPMMKGEWTKSGMRTCIFTFTQFLHLWRARDFFPILCYFRFMKS